MKYLHIMPPSKRMMYGYISMLQKGIDDNEHKVLFMSPLVGDDCALILFENTVDFSELKKGKLHKLFQIRKMFKEADRIVFHCFQPDFQWLVVTYLLRKYLSKAVWIMWGIDLYNYRNESRGLKAKLENYMGTICRKLMRYPVAIAEPDIAVYERTFGSYPVLFAPYGFVNERFRQMDGFVQKRKEQVATFEEDVENGLTVPYTELKSSEKVNPLSYEKYDGRIRVQIGHNGFAFNNHVYTLNVLERLMDHPDSKYLEFCLPISYGNSNLLGGMNYVGALINYAKMKYPDNSVFLRKMIPANLYTKYLSTVDIAIFNATRQNGLGNILQLLYMGKKIYMSKGNPLFPYLLSRGFEIHDVDELQTVTFEEFVAPVKAPCPNPWVKNAFGMENTVKLWQNVFAYVDNKIDYETAAKAVEALTKHG